MAKERMVNTRVWSDYWVSQLDPIEKLLFLYFLTNSYTNISGIYEMPLKVAAVETGIEPTMVDKVILRLHPKIITHKGWVIIPKFPKHQSLKSSDVVKGMQREFLSAPKEVQDLAVKGGWGEGVGIVPTPSGDTKPNLTKLKKEAVGRPTAIPLGVREVREDSGGKEKPPKQPRDTRALHLRDRLYSVLEKNVGVYPTTHIADYKQIQAALKVLSEEEIEDLFELSLAAGKARTVREALTARAVDIYRQDNA